MDTRGPQRQEMDTMTMRLFEERCNTELRALEHHASSRDLKVESDAAKRLMYGTL